MPRQCVPALAGEPTPRVRRFRTPAAALPLLWALGACQPTGPVEHAFQPSATAASRPVATSGPDDAVPSGRGDAAPAPSPAGAGCGSTGPAGRNCTPSP